MTHKHNIGDNVIYIGWRPIYQEYTVKSTMVRNFYVGVDCVTYAVDGLGELDGTDLYTPAEALEFITNYINKTEE